MRLLDFIPPQNWQRNQNLYHDAIMTILGFTEKTNIKVNNIKLIVRSFNNRYLKIQYGNNTFNIDVSFFKKTKGIIKSTTNKKGYMMHNQLLRDIEGELILDALNKNNMFHQPTDTSKILDSIK